jgi:hypothetical protein
VTYRVRYAEAAMRLERESATKMKTKIDLLQRAESEKELF